jgi:hypothetical protein
MNLSDEQDKTIARLTRLLEDRNEEIEELKKKLQKTDKQAQAFHAVLSGMGLRDPARFRNELPLEALQIGRRIRGAIQDRMKEETTFLRRRRALGFIGRVFTGWQEFEP